MQDTPMKAITTKSENYTSKNSIYSTYDGNRFDGNSSDLADETVPSSKS